MLKHVQIPPLRNRSDSLSIRLTTSCQSSLCGSPEPPSEQLRATSRASSYCSLNDAIPQCDEIHKNDNEAEKLFDLVNERKAISKRRHELQQQWGFIHTKKSHIKRNDKLKTQ